MHFPIFLLEVQLEASMGEPPAPINLTAPILQHWQLGGLAALLEAFSGALQGPRNSLAEWNTPQPYTDKGC